MNKDDLQNYETCKTIANEIEAFTERKMYRCPLCRTTFKWDDDCFNVETAEYSCKSCNEVLDESDLEALNVYDYLSDCCYDVEYRIDGNGNFKSVEIMVAAGGPNIYVDTGYRKVKLYWWNQRAEYPLSSDACNEIDSFFENCLPFNN